MEDLPLTKAEGAAFSQLHPRMCRALSPWKTLDTAQHRPPFPLSAVVNEGISQNYPSL